MKNLPHLFIGSTFGVGEFANFFVGAVFVFTLGIILRRIPGLKGSAISVLASTIVMSLTACLLNYFITIPLFCYVLNYTIANIIGLFKGTIHTVNSLWDVIIIFFSPFNLIKVSIISLLGLEIYHSTLPALTRIKGGHED